MHDIVVSLLCVKDLGVSLPKDLVKYQYLLKHNSK